MVAVVAAIVSAAACGGSADHSSSDTTAKPPSTTVVTFGGVPGVAQRIACQSDAQQFQRLSDYYKTLHGQPAPGLQTFVDDGAIDHVPTNDHGYVIEYDAATGRVTAKGACTFP